MSNIESHRDMSKEINKEKSKSEDIEQIFAQKKSDEEYSNEWTQYNIYNLIQLQYNFKYNSFFKI